MEKHTRPILAVQKIEKLIESSKSHETLVLGAVITYTNRIINIMIDGALELTEA